MDAPNLTAAYDTPPRMVHTQVHVSHAQQHSRHQAETHNKQPA